MTQPFSPSETISDANFENRSFFRTARSIEYFASNTVSMPECNISDTVVRVLQYRGKKLFEIKIKRDRLLREKASLVF